MTEHSRWDRSCHLITSIAIFFIGSVCGVYATLRVQRHPHICDTGTVPCFLLLLGVPYDLISDVFDSFQCLDLLPMSYYAPGLYHIATGGRCATIPHLVDGMLLTMSVGALVILLVSYIDRLYSPITTTTKLE